MRNKMLKAVKKVINVNEQIMAVSFAMGGTAFIVNVVCSLWIPVLEGSKK